MINAENAVLPFLLIAFAVFIFGAIIGFIVWVIIRAINHQKYKTLQNNQLLNGLGYTLVDPASIHNDGMYGISRGVDTYHYGFSTKLPESNNPLWGLTQSEEVGSGRNRTSYLRTIFRVEIPDTKAQVLINSKVNTIDGRGERFTEYDGENMEMEGNFSDYFNVTVPKGVQVEALTLLAPDTLEYILHNCAEFDIEIKGGNLYVYRNNWTDVTDLPGLVNIIDGLVKELTLRSGDARVINRDPSLSTQPSTVARTATDVQNFRGLKRRRWGGIAGIVVAILYFWIQWVGKGTAPVYIEVLSWAVIIGTVIFAALKAINSLHLKKRYNNEIIVSKKNKT